MEEKRDHIALLLPTLNQHRTQRKGFHRYWNQLPRCQKNLIVLTVIGLCITILLLLPSGSIQNVVVENKINQQQQQQRFNRISILKEDTTTNSKQNNNNNNNNIESHNDERNPIDKETEKIIIKPNIQIEQSINQIEPDTSKEFDKNQQNIDIQNGELNDERLKDILNKIEPLSEDNLNTFEGPKNERQIAVVEAFKHSWKGYKQFAWGHDNLKPMSASSHDWFGLGLTIIDSLDTMYIMNLQEEFREARDWVDTYLYFDINRDVNVFEVTIRVLGGLLSAYHLSGDKMFLKKSLELGNRLLPSFNSPSGIPYSDVNLASMRAHSPKWSPDSSTSEATTIQLEFRDLSRSTGVCTFEEAAQKVNEVVHNLEKTNGLVPIFINANTGTFRRFSTISLGARGDSYYEYLLKQWIQTGRKVDDILIQDYKIAIDGVLQQLVKKTPRDHLTYVGELISGKDFKPKMDHLTCYLPGTLLLGHKFGMPESHLKLANELLETCYQTYIRQPTGLAPEITYFSLDEAESEFDIQVKSNDAHNLLRPEFIESLYYFYAITHNKTYQDMGWKVFEAFEKYTKVKNGYTSIGNVKNTFNTRPRDMMESFWLGETLKYLYLLFSDNYDEINLDKYVFNTEAHPLPIYKLNLEVKNDNTFKVNTKNHDNNVM